MYGTVSTICCDLLKAYENHEKIAVIIWCEVDVREMGAEFNPTADDIQSVLRAIGESDSDALWRDGIGQNFVEGVLRELVALRPPRQIAVPEDVLRTLLPLMEAGMNLPPPFSPSASDGVQSWQVSLSVGGYNVRTESRGKIERRAG